MKTMMKQASQAIAFAIVTLAATGTLVLAGMREDSRPASSDARPCLPAR
jgi:hypothetical protein